VPFAQQRCSVGKPYAEVQADLVVRFTVVLEEVLSRAHELIALDGDAEFFLELAADRFPGLLASIHSAARKRPERVPIEPVQQQAALVDCDGGSTIVKAVRTDTDANHAA